MSTDADPLNPIRENRDALESVAERYDDELAARSRVFLALERGDDPDPDDVDMCGYPDWFLDLFREGSR